MSYFDKNSKFLDKNNMYFDKNDNLNLLYNGNDNKTCYITAKLVI